MSVPEQYFRAGHIAADVRNEIEKRVKTGDSLLHIANTVEDLIRTKGGEPAFPCNVCLNEVAAHFTPFLDDQQSVSEGDLLKIDIGVHVEGFIADTATSISLNPMYDDLVEATRTALSEAVKLLRRDIKAGEIGDVISSVARRWGFKPIVNLSGHMLDQFRVHAGISIPNVWVSSTERLKSDTVYAIEPFLTTQEGAGHVVEGESRSIFSFLARKKTRDKELDEMIERIWSRYKTLPFSARWLIDSFDRNRVREMLERLVELKILRTYPILIEARGAYVAQAEHTVAMTEDGFRVLT